MPLDDEDKLKMVELAAMGYSQSAIARRFGCSPQYVSAVLLGQVEKAQEARRQNGVGASRTKQEARSKPTTRKTAARRTTS